MCFVIYVVVNYGMQESTRMEALLKKDGELGAAQAEKQALLAAKPEQEEGAAGAVTVADVALEPRLDRTTLGHRWHVFASSLKDFDRPMRYVFPVVFSICEQPAQQHRIFSAVRPGKAAFCSL